MTLGSATCLGTAVAGQYMVMYGCCSSWAQEGRSSTSHVSMALMNDWHWGVRKEGSCARLLSVMLSLISGLSLPSKGRRPAWEAG